MLTGFVGSNAKHFADVAKVVHQTKWKLIKMRQEQNRSYKEVCAPVLEKCRYVYFCISHQLIGRIALFEMYQRHLTKIMSVVWMKDSVKAAIILLTTDESVANILKGNNLNCSIITVINENKLLLPKKRYQIGCKSALLQKFVSENLVCMMMCTFSKNGTQILEESTVLGVC